MISSLIVEIVEFQAKKMSEKQYLMKNKIDQTKETVNSPNKNFRFQSVKEIAQTGDTGQLKILFKKLFQKRIGNEIAILIKAIGDFQNANGIEPLIDIYGEANKNEKKLINEALLKLGAFRKFFDGNKYPLNILENLEAMLFGASSPQLKRKLSLSKEEFLENLDFAWRTTKHWRVKKKK